MGRPNSARHPQAYLPSLDLAAIARRSLASTAPGLPACFVETGAPV